MNGIKLPLTLSATGHAAGLAALILFLHSKAAPVPEPVAKGGIEVAFEPALPKSEAAPLSQSPLQPETLPPPAEALSSEPQVEAAPPTPEAPAVATEPTPPVPEAPVAATEPPPPAPPRKPMIQRPQKPPPRHIDTAQPLPTPAPSPQTAPAAIAAPPQTASAATPVPAPLASPEASAGYRALLSAWLDSHKRYPDAARQRGEEGRAVLRFEVDRNGRVIDYVVVKSSGYQDLDGSIEEMMRGATLPPFPAGMTQPRLEVSVTIRFSLAR